MILPHLPQRQEKPRSQGITMMMDKGLSTQEVSNIIEVSGHLIDFAKLGFGTSVVSKKVKEKVKLYHAAGIKVFLGGTLFEACYIRDSLDVYENFIHDLEIDCVEISDGSIAMDHKKKCELINRFSQNRLVLSEVGAKEAEVFTDTSLWVHHMKAELEAGSSFVIAEARESGNVGIYKNTGKADHALIDEILQNIPPQKVLWEAPQKSQQVWFIKLLGFDVNLGNIAPTDIIPLETLRLGLRGDTFLDVLPPEFQQFRIQ